jgi:hypothetical protein
LLLLFIYLFSSIFVIERIDHYVIRLIVLRDGRLLCPWQRYLYFFVTGERIQLLHALGAFEAPTSWRDLERIFDLLELVKYLAISFRKYDCDEPTPWDNLTIRQVAEAIMFPTPWDDFTIRQVAEAIIFPKDIKPIIFNIDLY